MTEAGLCTEDQEKTILLDKIQSLEAEIDKLKKDNRQTSELLYEFTRRTLLSSASIQTAVSSMLSDNFLWDGSSDREFLEIIDDSINFICNQLSLVSMLLRIQSSKAEIRYDSYPVDEIMNGMVDAVQKRLKKENFPVRSINFNIAESDKLINADFNYINTGLALLISGLSDFSDTLTINGAEEKDSYIIQVRNCSQSVAEMIQHLVKEDALPNGITQNRYSNTGLKLLVSTKLLTLQNIIISPVLTGNEQPTIIITLPISEKPAQR